MAALSFSPQDVGMTVAEYLAIEERSEERHELFDGRVSAIEATSPNHNTLTVNICGHLHEQLRGRLPLAWGGGQRLRINTTNLVTYPDVLISCPPHEWDDELPNTLLNPTVIIEVLSSSTEAYDRGEKFNHYRRLPSLTDYLLVATSRVHIEHFRRHEGDDWLLHIAESLDETLVLTSVDCRLTLAELYERLEFGDDANSR